MKPQYQDDRQKEDSGKFVTICLILMVLVVLYQAIFG
jgi:hypothetical protein